MEKRLDDLVSESTDASRDMTRSWQEFLLDQALEETFPASDPISPMCPRSID